MLTPMIRLTPKRHVTSQLPPTTDCGECMPNTATVGLPKINHDWLARRQEIEAVRYWQFAVGVAVILAEGKECAVWCQKVEGVLHVVVELNLWRHRVGLQ